MNIDDPKNPKGRCYRLTDNEFSDLRAQASSMPHDPWADAVNELALWRSVFSWATLELGAGFELQIRRDDPSIWSARNMGTGYLICEENGEDPLDVMLRLKRRIEKYVARG